MSIIGNPLTVGGSGGVDGLNNCLRFSSPSTFTLEVADHTKHWDGRLEWTDGTNEWTTWDGTTTLSASGGFLALRGTGNTVITGSETPLYRWVLSGSNIRCDGNIETLLDYATVASGNHPQMGQYCFAYLFYWCRKLVRAPALSATLLAKGCYNNMFSLCESLTEAPTLPATTLANGCYYNMFLGCTSLTAAPVLPATTMAQQCYQGMFDGCTSLATAPLLPATTLALNCYGGMFRGCTSLKAAPALPATTLTNYCYRSMFQGCTSIRLSQSQSGDYQYAYRIPTTGTGTTATDALKDMFSETGGAFTGTPSINTTYYTTNPPIG